jgi:hypothetical protein
LDEGSINTNVKPLTELAPNITTQIFQALEFRDLDTAGRVCKQWRELSSNLSLWKDLYKVYDARVFGGTNIRDLNVCCPVCFSAVLTPTFISPLVGEQDKHLWDELGTDFSTAPDVTPGGVREASLNALVAAVTPQVHFLSLSCCVCIFE